MTDVIEHEKPDWIFLGETERTMLLHWMLPDIIAPDWGNQPIWLEYGPSSVINRINVGWQARSKFLLPGMYVLLATSWEQAAVAGRKRTTRIGILESYPFGRQSTRRMIQEMQHQAPLCGVLVILIDLPIRRGSTDLIPPQDLLEQQYQVYQRNGAVKILRGPNELPALLYWQQDSLQGQFHQVMRELDEMQSSIETIQYDYELLDWEFQQQILSLEELEKICSFRTAKVYSPKNLWSAYQKKAEEVLFPVDRNGGLIGPVVELYTHSLQVLNPMIWDMQKDCEGLYDRLRRAYNAWMSVPRWQTLRVELLTEENYEIVSAESGINAAFHKRYKEYINQEALRIVKSYLQYRYKKIKEVLQ